MWRVYGRNRKDDDYTNYKEALNVATNEIRQSKSYEQNLACNIKLITARVCMHMSGVNKTYETRLDHYRRQCGRPKLILQFSV